METNKQSQQNSGSSENKRSTREAQKNRLTHLSEKDKQNIANDINENESRISGVDDLGGRSGREDYAGATNDGMSDESSNEETER